MRAIARSSSINFAVARFSLCRLWSSRARSMIPSDDFRALSNPGEGLLEQQETVNQ
jgi:hypothetical protein